MVVTWHLFGISPEASGVGQGLMRGAWHRRDPEKRYCRQVVGTGPGYQRTGGSLYGAEDEKQAESAKAGAEQLSVAPHPLLCLWYSETQPVSGRIQHEAL